MEENLLKLTISDTAQFSIDTLDAHDHRLITNWLESIRRWHLDDYARSRSTRLNTADEQYVFRTATSDMMIAFRLTDDEVVVEAIMSKELLRQFQAAREGTPT